MRIPSCLVALVCCSLVSATDWPIPRGASHEPQPYRYDATIWKTVPADFLDDAPACILYAATTHLIDPDGTIESITHEITRPASRKSVEKLGEFRGITYNPAYQKATLNIARIHKAKGGIVEVEPRHLHLRDSGTDYLVYSAEKQLVISFPSLEVGDVLEVKWTLRGKNPEHLGQFFNRYSFGDTEYPIVKDELRIRLPKGKTLHHACAAGKLTPKISESDGMRLFHWSATNLRPPLAEEDRPSKEELRPQVVTSTFNSWEKVGEWKRKVRAECWECTAPIKQIVAEVTRDLKTPLDKARALAYWVRRNIRYVSAGARHDYTPHKPGEVLANRHGDCKDTSQLLAVMYREVGISCALVTLGFLDDGQVIESVPSPWGTHGILVATIDGKDHWIDTTATMSGWNVLPRACRDRVCYVTDEKTILLKRTPSVTPLDNRFEQTTEVSIGPDLSSRSKRTEIYQGLAASSQRDRWLEVPVGEQRRVTVARLLDNNNQARLNALTIDEETLGDFDRPLKATVEFTIPGHFAGKDHDASFTDSRVWNFLLAYNLDADRQLPLELANPVDTKHTFLLRAPAGFEFDGLPRTRSVQSKWGTFTRVVAWMGDSYRGIRVDFHLRLEKTRVEPADFEEFRRFHKQVTEAYRLWVALERTWHRKDLPEMEAVSALVPDNVAAATLLVEQHLRLGDKAEARRVLKRVRYYRPDEVGLLELAVKAASSVDEAEKAQRELVLRQPQDPTQAIALAAMLIERGKPALAEPLLETLASTAPPVARGLATYQLARAALKQGKAAEAMKHLDTSAAFDNSKAHVLAVEMLRGQALEKLDRQADALTSYRKAHRVDPKAEDALLAVIELALTRGEKEVAGEHLREYVVLVRDRLPGLNRAADFALRLGWQQEAFSLASQARELGFNEGTQRILGLLHLQRGEPDKAIFHLERADPTASVLEGLIRANLALGRLQKAEREAQRAGLIPQPTDELKQAKTRVEGLTTRREVLLKQLAVDAEKRRLWMASVDCLVCAEELRQQKRTPARIEALLALADVQLGPVLSMRALLALERGKLGEALSLADRAIRLSPWDSRGWYVRGKVRLERLTLGSVEDLRKAAEISAYKDADILHALAEALQEAGQREAATEILRKVILLRPNDTTLMELLRDWDKVFPRP